jgi:transcriptional regulator with XRE-family HTH domain
MSAKSQKTTGANKYRYPVLKSAIYATAMNQNAVAKRARIDPVRLSQILTGRRDPRPQEQERLARVIGRPVHELFPEDVVL